MIIQIYSKALQKYSADHGAGSNYTETEGSEALHRARRSTSGRAAALLGMEDTSDTEVEKHLNAFSLYLCT